MRPIADTSLLAACPWWRPDAATTLEIRGGRPLVGAYPISGAKNAVLPLMMAALVTPHLVTSTTCRPAWTWRFWRTCSSGWGWG